MTPATSPKSSDTEPMFLVRLGAPSRSDTIHRSTCIHAQKPNALRWNFADANPDYDWAVDAPWLKSCKRCDPPSPFSKERDA